MKRYRIEAWIGVPEANPVKPDYSTTFPSETMMESLNDKDGFAACFLEAVARERDPWKVTIKEVEG